MVHSDEYGGSVHNHTRLVVEAMENIRAAVGPHFPIAIKMNSTDGIQGGLMPQDSLQVIRALDPTSVDLIEISGGTYFPGARKLSKCRGSGPYFTRFALRAWATTSKPLMVTGGFKTRDQAEYAIAHGAAGIVGLARALVLNPESPENWLGGGTIQPHFPFFSQAPKGAVTTWYTMKLSEYGGYGPSADIMTAEKALAFYNQRDPDRVNLWNQRFL